MIIVGWPDCDTCNILKEMYPNLDYIEITPVSKDARVRKIKKLIGKHGLDYFPLLVNDEITEFIPMKNLDPKFAKEHPKLY